VAAGDGAVRRQSAAVSAPVLRDAPAPLCSAILDARPTDQILRKRSSTEATRSHAPERLVVIMRQNTRNARHGVAPGSRGA
jgi:hypothetical protein